MSYKRAVVQKDQHGRVLGTYDSIKEASESTGVSWWGISKCLSNQQKTSCGFIWEYAFITPTNEAKYSTPVKRKKEIKLKPNETLCCYCDTCSPKCSWKRCFKPVEGWEARLNAKKTSYIVSKCPLFTSANNS